MKITGNIPKNIGNIYQKQQKAAPTKKTAETDVKKDSLELSNEAKKISELVQKTKDFPEIREEKIKEIKEQIKNNTYQVSPEQLAAKMLSKNRI
ncbi:anti-sigma-28 factor, FlgM family [Desulfonispora thiosulfatigenes DSM 11270]|uniref:Negative regulator of flagellin synthesis n=1 Tax=Desulfonispora thiosulfatigenes DSM 11270 TaxID=656914 RepID=A0A1W1UNZ0_DESTI|nr:flagellar biosynthesis anti-sigma factor FlgM [Desulfonispora thiosulfatigenes]SMB82838.1 anti-sigma-28 factor, FlgM family [Desulfonispora thiosulfatigenes DSM 11270]